MIVLGFLAFTAALGFALLALGETLGTNSAKITAALRGQSLMAQPVMATRPVSVRMVSRRVSQPVSVQPRLRAAA